MVECEVIVDEEGAEGTLEILKTRNWDCFEIKLNGKKICSGDWFGNLRPEIVKTLRWKDDR